MRFGAPLIRFLPALGFLAAASARAQMNAPEVEIANLREDVNGLSQKVGDLSLQVEQLEHDNGVLSARLQSRGSAGDGAVTPAQLNAAVADLNAAIHSAVSASRSEILERVGTQLEALAKQTDAALDSIQKGASHAPVRAADQPTPEDASAVPGGPSGASSASAPEAEPAAGGAGLSQVGVSYTIQKGDTLAAIARKTGGKVREIIEANKLADPSRIQAGQTLFIPGGK